MPGEESIHDGYTRFTNELIELGARHSCEKVRSFLMESLIRTLLAEIKDVEIYKLQLSNCDVIEIIYDPQNPSFPFSVVEN